MFPPEILVSPKSSGTGFPSPAPPAQPAAASMGDKCGVAKLRSSLQSVSALIFVSAHMITRVALGNILCKGWATVPTVGWGELLTYFASVELLQNFHSLVYLP